MPKICPKCRARAAPLDSDLCRPCLAARVAAKRRRRAKRADRRDWQAPPAVRAGNSRSGGR
jgi:hypothetical protein